MTEELWADTAAFLIFKTLFNSCFYLGFNINLT